MSKKALFLSGGGARGAYQVGALKALNEILETKTIPVEILSSVSVGSINAAMLAQHADDFPKAVKKLETLWANIHCGQVYKANNWAVLSAVLRNLSYLILGRKKSSYLLNTTPLKELINTNINIDSISQHIEQGTLELFEIISNCYDEHKTYSFYQTQQQDVFDWHYPRHISQKFQVSDKHVLASSALPLFFPAVKLNDKFFGDGSLRLISPLRGCVQFKAEKILVIGTRQRAHDIDDEEHRLPGVGFAQVLGNMLNAIFMDNLDRDIELIDRINSVAILLSRWKQRKSPWRPIDIIYLRPEVDIADVAQSYYSTIPHVLRFLLNSLGAKNHSGDLLSFLLFESEFCQRLISLGYEETMHHQQAVIEFFQ